MRVFKFGGASLKSADAIRNMAGIVQNNIQNPLLVVVSAMGKTTNALEKLLLEYEQGHDVDATLNSIKLYHHEIIENLFGAEDQIVKQVEKIYHDILLKLQLKGASDFLYDQVVSQGELLSSIIVAGYLNKMGIACNWVDARKYITTDETYREGKVDWESTTNNIQLLKQPLIDAVHLTQGFIGGTSTGYTTTLGREGSDFTAAIFASCLQATSVTIWKDVPGVMNADPKKLPAAIVFDELPFKEAAEMTYYGASVIHPKTIKPLALKGIPLNVKCFDDPKLNGTKIHECLIDSLPPLIVFKDNQCLVSCRVTDYTFVNEQQLSYVFQALSELDIKINVMQNSAISFSFCIDFRENKVMALIDKLKDMFEVYYNTGLTLITVKNYNEETFDRYRKQSGVLLEQSSRSTLQVLVKD